MKKLNEVYQTRAWLNNIDFCGGANIKTELQGNHYRINIASCHEKIELHGSIGSTEALANAFHKIDTLIEHLQGLRNAITNKSKENAIKEAKKAEKAKAKSKGKAKAKSKEKAKTAS